jgi:hypothetical protein
VSNLSRNMSCEEFQTRLAVMIGSGENMADHPHIRSCELCRALLADLETIAEAARQLLPVEEPPEKLWDKIETAIKNENGGKGSAERGLTHQK